MVKWNDFCSLYSLLALLFGNPCSSQLGLFISSRVCCKHSHYSEHSLLFKMLLLRLPSPNPSSSFSGWDLPYVPPKGHLSLMRFSQCQPLGLITSVGFFQVLQWPLHWCFWPVMLIICVYDSSPFIYIGNPAEGETQVCACYLSKKGHVIQSWMRPVWGINSRYVGWSLAGLFLHEGVSGCWGLE